MARSVDKLSDRTVKTIKKPGRHSDGGNLYLNVKDGGSKSWLFIYRIGGKQREMGLGDLKRVTLAKAREIGRVARDLLGKHKDPLVEMRKPDKPTFGERADAYIKANKPAWKNEKHIAQWEMTMREYAKPIREKSVDQITTADMVAILEPIWITKHDTAIKVRQRIEAILDSAKSLGHFSGDNPASKKILKTLLPNYTAPENHHAALEIEKIPDFMKLLRLRSGTSALALEFTILTASRTGEVIGAKWDEIDDLGWLVPAPRMKGKKEHRVPLCNRALEILDEMRKLDSPYIFPGPKRDKHLSNMAMAQMLEDLDDEITVHGFRSTFRDWASEHTNVSRDVCEMALAHAIESKTEAAYRRGDLFMKRFDLAQTWAKFCAGEMGQIVSLAERLKEARASAA